MKVLIDKSFERDVKKYASDEMRETIANIIEKIRTTGSINEIAQCKKLKGSKKAFRIRVGNYRIGFVYEKNAIVLIRFLHRNRIYTNFP
jgi:mRNA interferase RelE/StbE